MPKRNTKRNRVLKEFKPDEAQPQRCRLFRHAFIAVARTLSAAGLTSNAELATYFGVSGSTIANWKIQFPAFDQAVQGGCMEVVAECTGRMLKFSREGSESATRFILERRAPAFMAKSKVDLNHTRNTLEEVLRERMSEDDLRREGIIYDRPEDDDDDDGYEDDPLPAPRPVKQLPQGSRQASARRELEEDEAELRRQGVIHDEPDRRRKPGFVDDKRPYDFGQNRYK